MMTELNATRDALCNRLIERGVPEHGANSLSGYIVFGLMPGGFMQAILMNDLMGAALRADDMNQHHLFAYAKALYSDVPRAAWGSREAVIRWLDHDGLSGLDQDGLSPKERTNAEMAEEDA